MSGTGETIQCREATNGLTAHPAKSEFRCGNKPLSKASSIGKQPFKNADKKTDLLRIVIKLFLYRDIE
ncbi:hypothetical protein UN64_03080 [Fictibacillus arsenicus]|uniref:Uncharacterized protein n=1 Tax=Fictibacillus arsenicus TaxID=255247 RepID=A0A1V3GBH4_9BACL|nr:hypothetical protein UN64_03080 [Fictibacillus arsenicus]